MAETMQSRRRSRLVRIGSTVAIIAAAALAIWGFSRDDDDRSPDTSIPLIGVIEQPAVVQTTKPAAAVPGSAPATDDVPLIPVGTADVAFPPVSSPTSGDIATP